MTNSAQGSDGRPAHGSLLLAGAFRSDAERFFTALRARGFAGTRGAVREWEDVRPQVFFLWTFRRSG